MKRPHEVLGVAINATPEQIKKAYRKLAQKHHPDRHPDDPEAIVRFQEVQSAYAAMTSQRAPGTAEPRGAWADFGQFSHMFDHFDQVFRRSQTQNASLILLELTLEDILKGGPHTFDEDVQEACTCSILSRSTCKICKGTGVVRTHRHTYRVDIPPGATDGMQLTCQNTKRVNQQKTAVVRTKEHPIFKREGADLWRKVAVDYTALVLGGGVTVNGLRGSVAFTLPTGIKPGQNIRLPGQGLPNLRGGMGDLYLVVDVHIPDTTALTPRQREAMIALAQALADS